MNMNNETEEMRFGILNAASTCFREAGVGKSRLRDIAARAGVEVNDITAMFQDKAMLSFAVQGHELERLKSDYLSNMPDASLSEVLKFIMRARCEFVEKNQKQTMYFFRNSFMGKQPWSTVLDQLVWKISIEFASLFEKAIRDGAIGKDTDVNIAVRALISFYLTGIVTQGLRAESFDADTVWGFIEPQVDLLMDGLKA